MMTNGTSDTFFRKLSVALCAAFCLSALWWGGSGQNLAQAEAAEGEEQLWSFRFENLSVAEVLKQLSEKTGIDITTNQSPQEKRVTKSYENETVEGIIRDIFRGASYTLVWNYSDTEMSSVGVYFFDQGGSRVDSRPSSSRARSRSPAVDRDDGGKPPSRSRVSRPSRPATRSPAASKGRGKTPPKKSDPDDDDDDDDEDDDEDEDDKDEEEE